MRCIRNKPYLNHIYLCSRFFGESRCWRKWVWKGRDMSGMVAVIMQMKEFAVLFVSQCHFYFQMISILDIFQRYQLFYTTSCISRKNRKGHSFKNRVGVVMLVREILLSNGNSKKSENEDNTVNIL